MPELEKAAPAKAAELKEAQKHGSFLREEVTEEDIAAVVSKWTGIPVDKMLEGEQKRLLQHGGAPARARRRPGRGGRGGRQRRAPRARRAAGSQPPDRLVHLPRPDRRRARPSWRARSPSSCSTTRRHIVRIDMSEYMEKHAVSRLIGAPPGYVGYDEGGQLTEAVRRRPYSVVLFDEIEKAHPDVFNMLLQVLDDGRLTDGQGRTVDFSNTVVIMTSNVGSQDLQRRGPTSSAEGARCMARAAARLPARVPEPRRRHRRLPPARPTRRSTASSTSSSGGCASCSRSATSSSSSAPEARHLPRRPRLRPAVRRAAAQARHQRHLQDPLARRILAGEFKPGDTIAVGTPDGRTS